MKAASFSLIADSLISWSPDLLISCPLISVLCPQRFRLSVFQFSLRAEDPIAPSFFTPSAVPTTAAALDW